jgi:hypothetical protein
MQAVQALCDRGPGCDGHCRDREVALGAEISRHRQALDVHYPLMRTLLESGRYTHGATHCRTLKGFIERYGGARGGTDLFLSRLWQVLDGEEMSDALRAASLPAPSRAISPPLKRGDLAGPISSYKRTPGVTRKSLLLLKTCAMAEHQAGYRKTTMMNIIDLAVREFNHNHPIPRNESLGVDDPNAPEESAG